MRLQRSILTALASLALAAPALAQTETPVGTAFTYQGQLQKGAGPHNGTADFVFRMYDAAAGGLQHGSTNTVTGLAVSNGVFTTTLDFGNPYSGRAVWLEIQVKTPGDANYTTLSPRQRIHAVPYAVTSLNGGGGPWLTQPGGINYNGHVGIQSLPSSAIALTVAVPSGVDNNGLYVNSSSASYATMVVRNFGTNGYGIFDDTSGRHHLAGNLGIGLLPTVPLDVLNPLGKAVKIVGTGSILDDESVSLSVWGNTGGGVFGRSQIGILSRSTDNRAIAGFSTNSFGVTGDCTAAQTWGALGTANEGVFGFSGNVARPAAHFMAPSGGTAINAEGLVKVKTLQILGGADVAEPFDIRGGDGDGAAAPEPGSLVVIDEANPGDLRVSDRAYDTRVAGVVSGANGLAPGMVLRAEGGELADGAHAVALTGRVWCKADAGYGAIAPGDLLTTSPTSGHAMKASDASRRSGAVIGKAMTALADGRGQVLVLVNLQ
jgi:hypothetical protein